MTPKLYRRVSPAVQVLHMPDSSPESLQALEDFVADPARFARVRHLLLPECYVVRGKRGDCTVEAPDIFRAEYEEMVLLPGGTP